MEIFAFATSYFIAAILCFAVLYTNGLGLNFRLENKYDIEKSDWQNFLADMREGIRIFVFDFFQLHCPWSKEVSITYRVHEARRMLQHCTHEKGWRMADCDNPANHRQIAYDCFELRATFWLKNITNFLFSPLQMMVMVVMTIIALICISIYEFCQWVMSRLTNRPV